MCEFSIFYFLLPFPPETDLISDWKMYFLKGASYCSETSKPYLLQVKFSVNFS